MLLDLLFLGLTPSFLLLPTGFLCILAYSKKFTCNAGDLGLIPGSRRSPEEGKGNPLKHSCLENSMDRGAWQPAVLITKNWTQLSD